MVTSKTKWIDEKNPNHNIHLMELLWIEKLHDSFSCLEMVDPERRHFRDFGLFKPYEGYPVSVITIAFALLVLQPPCLLILF